MLEPLVGPAVSPGAVPGAVAMAGRGPSVLGTVSAGYAADTVFDLASLTKVVATTTVTLALGIRLDRFVADFVPARLWRGVTVRHLLTHTSGLPATPIKALRRAVHAQVTPANTPPASPAPTHLS